MTPALIKLSVGVGVSLWAPEQSLLAMLLLGLFLPE